MNILRKALLPTVAVVQLLLNRKLKEGGFIAVDGHYGPKTAERLALFQKSKGLSPDGVVGMRTWLALAQGEPCAVIDSSDVADHQDHRLFVAPIQAAGGAPLANYGMSNGVQVACQRILAQGKPRATALLRFIGHGGPGVQGVAYGRYGNASGTPNALEAREGSATIAYGNLWQNADMLQPIRGLFAPYGSAELHGCHTAKGPAGLWLLRTLATLWGVPVTAGTRSQRSLGNRLYRFEGPTITAFPNEGDLRGWARSLQAEGVHGMSVGR